MPAGVEKSEYGRIRSREGAPGTDNGKSKTDADFFGMTTKKQGQGQLQIPLRFGMRTKNAKAKTRAKELQIPAE